MLGLALGLSLGTLGLVWDLSVLMVYISDADGQTVDLRLSECEAISWASRPKCKGTQPANGSRVSPGQPSDAMRCDVKAPVNEGANECVRACMRGIYHGPWDARFMPGSSDEWQ
jgi:hypothetical protein